MSSHLFQFIVFVDNTNLFTSHFNSDDLLKILNQEIEKISNWLKLTNFL